MVFSVFFINGPVTRLVMVTAFMDIGSVEVIRLKSRNVGNSGHWSGGIRYGWIVPDGSFCSDKDGREFQLNVENVKDGSDGSCQTAAKTITRLRKEDSTDNDAGNEQPNDPSKTSPRPSSMNEAATRANGSTSEPRPGNEITTTSKMEKISSCKEDGTLGDS
ncbi:hypothetical protein R1sor_008857 [Riccia sorocarpa]|uniref:Uncharacterized protein n=1 Tax=Riccia sorocarpa TaxID=122646 RepID=A0ABD3H452_9MARC